MRKEIFEEDHYYHVYCRGVEGLPIFRNDRDRVRFINTLYLLNNFTEIPRRFDAVSLAPQELLVPSQPLVKIVAGALMPNHYHLMLTPARKNGISLFQHKIGTSYTKFFNIKYERIGRLFGSTFKAKFVDRQEYALYLTQYIHLNPVKLFLSQAKLGTEGVLRKVENYSWSTLPDYLGKKSNFSIALSKDDLSYFQDQILGLKAELYQPFLKEIFYSMSQA